MADLGRGALAGVAGSVVMTTFQKLVEMPISGREDSYGPAQLVQKLLPVKPGSDAGMKRLNYAAHTALGAMWGAAYGAAAHQGLRGLRGTATTFGAIYTQDLVMITALGLGKPWTWSRKEATIDVLDKVVVIAATGAIFDRFLSPSDR
ncbi:hypothetical protein SAMN05661080_00523 [Modestobacter sp. DSM 44400]|uniref:hypothetical protein n=1 Tax=Modestobacter sp. DSM 44400 TaxID=1550230 RepID=UPI00089AF2E2|nr:hypothetical protein [Modestobacter sp. DSM 44400]SDX59991.1 hypothetical protein SAMN05661080_00523 [Modestobacter sp. DSM 44400]